MFWQKILLKDFKHIFAFGNGLYTVLGFNEIKEKNYYDENTLLQ